MRSRRRCSGSCTTSSRQRRSRPSVRPGRPARSARALARSSRTGRRQGRLAGRRPGGRDRRLVGAVERRQIKLGDGVDHKPRTHRADSPGQPDRLWHHPRPLQTVETVDSLSEKDIAAHSKPLALRSGVERDAVRTGDGGDGSRLRDDDANGQAKRITRKGPSRPWARLYPAVDSFAAPLCGSAGLGPYRLDAAADARERRRSPTAMPAVIARISPEPGDAGMRPASDDRRPPAERRIGGG